MAFITAEIQDIDYVMYDVKIKSIDDIPSGKEVRIFDISLLCDISITTLNLLEKLKFGYGYGFYTIYLPNDNPYLVTRNSFLEHLDEDVIKERRCRYAPYMEIIEILMEESMQYTFCDNYDISSSESEEGSDISSSESEEE